MSPDVPPGGGRRPADMDLDEMHRLVARLERDLSREERRSQARDLEVQALRAELSLLQAKNELLARDLTARPVDLERFEQRVIALGEALEHVASGGSLPEQGSLSADIAAAPMDASGASGVADPEPGSDGPTGLSGGSQ